jgi:peroxiredoxin
MGIPSLFPKLSVLLFLAALSGRAFAAPEPLPVLTGASVSGPAGPLVSYSLSSAERATVVVFLSAKCPCSSSHEAALSKLHREFAPKGFGFIGVHSNADEPVALAREHFAGSALPFPVISDPAQKYADSYGALKTPHVFVIDREGKLRFQGGVDDSKVHALAKRFYLKDALSALAAGQEPPLAVARALGCAIKRN